MPEAVHTPAELVAVMGAWVRSTELESLGWRFAQAAAELTVGATVVAYGHGRWRRGIVTKVGRVNARVEYVTPTNVEDARKAGRPVNDYVPVRGITDKIGHVLILPAAPAPAPVVEEASVVEEAPVESLTITVDVDSVNRSLERAGHPARVTEEDVRAAGMVPGVVEPTAVLAEPQAEEEAALVEATGPAGGTELQRAAAALEGSRGVELGGVIFGAGVLDLQAPARVYRDPETEEEREAFRRTARPTGRGGGRPANPDARPVETLRVGPELAEPAEAREYRVTFDRIGRTSHGAVEVFRAADATELAELVHRFAAPKLLSGDCLVTVNLREGWLQLDGGRYGEGRVELVE